MQETYNLQALSFILLQTKRCLFYTLSTDLRENELRLPLPTPVGVGITELGARIMF